MFTGLIEETGTIISTEIRGTSRRIRIKAQKFFKIFLLMIQFL